MVEEEEEDFLLERIRQSRPLSSAILWAVTLLTPFMINTLGPNEGIYAPLWFIYYAAGGYAFSFVLDMIQLSVILFFGIPIILCSLAIELYSRGVLKSKMTKILIVFSYIIPIAIAIPINLYYPLAFIPLPITTALQYIIYESIYKVHFGRIAEETRREPVPLQVPRWQLILMWLITLGVPFLVFWYPHESYLIYTIYAPFWIFVQQSFSTEFYTILLPISPFWIFGLLTFVMGIPILFSALFVTRLANGHSLPKNVRRVILASFLYIIAIFVIFYLLNSIALFIPVPIAFLLHYSFYLRLLNVYKFEQDALRTQPPSGIAFPSTIGLIEAARGGTIIGGKFEYKVKVSNESKFVITNVTVNIVAYPEDCMKAPSKTIKKISRIEPGGFRSPEFIFTPTKDCVEGQIVASVSYMDQENRLQMLEIEPYIIRSVCDLLEPLESTIEEFEFMLGEMETSHETITINQNPDTLYSSALSFLPSRNFYIIEASSSIREGEFSGAVRCLAEGKYTKKKVAARVRISGKIGGNKSEIAVEALGEDSAMLPVTIDEIVKGLQQQEH